MKDSDLYLLEQYLLHQDKLAFDTLYRKYRDLVYGVGLKYLKNTGDAEELVADVFQKIEKITAPIQIKNFTAWIYKVAKNLCIDKYRVNQTYRRKLEEVQQFQKSSSNFVENDAVIRLDNEGTNHSTHINNAIEQLKPDQATCIKLFFFEEMTYQEIAKKQNFDLNQVKSHLQNGKRKLKLLLQDFVNGV